MATTYPNPVSPHSSLTRTAYASLKLFQVLHTRSSLDLDEPIPGFITVRSTGSCRPKIRLKRCLVQALLLPDLGASALRHRSGCHFPETQVRSESHCPCSLQCAAHDVSRARAKRPKTASDKLQLLYRHPTTSQAYIVSDFPHLARFVHFARCAADEVGAFRVHSPIEFQLNSQKHYSYLRIFPHYVVWESDKAARLFDYRIGYNISRLRLSWG
jgi:hypothetical protein